MVKKLKSVTYEKKGKETYAVQNYEDGSTKKVKVRNGVVDYIINGDKEESKVFIERAAPLTIERIRAVCGTEEEYSKYVKELTKDKETLNWPWEDRELEKCISLLLNNDLKDIEKYHIKAYYNSLLEDTTNDGLF